MIQLKSDSEIDGIRTSGHMLAEMFEEIGPQIQAGMSTWDVDKLFHDWMKRHHAGAPCVGYMGYPAATCVSVNDMVIHGIPSKKEILKDGDVSILRRRRASISVLRLQESLVPGSRISQQQSQGIAANSDMALSGITADTALASSFMRIPRFLTMSL